MKIKSLELDQGFFSVLVIIFVAVFKSINIAGSLIFILTVQRLFETCFYEKLTAYFKDKNVLTSSSLLVTSSEKEDTEMSEMVEIISSRDLSSKFESRVISLERRPDRYEGFVKRFSPIEKFFDEGRGANLFNAVDGKNAEAFFEENKDERLIKIFKSFDLNVSRGELGCLLSHYFVLKNISLSEETKTPLKEDSGDKDKIFFIFEDDVFVSDEEEHVKDAFALIYKFTSEMPTDEWDLLYVSGRWSSSFIANEDVLSSSTFVPVAICGTSKIFSRNLSSVYNKGSNYNVDRCTTGMVVSSKSAKKICDAIYNHFASLNPSEVTSLTPIDHLLLKIDSLKTFDVFPHPFYSPHNYETDIQGRSNWEDVFNLSS